MRCEASFWRFMRQPIRRSAAKARLAVVDGHAWMGFSGGNEGYVHGARDGLTMFQSAGNET